MYLHGFNNRRVTPRYTVHFRNLPAIEQVHTDRSKLALPLIVRLPSLLLQPSQDVPNLDPNP